MAVAAQDRPCIHVCFVDGADQGLYRWVEIGAEEEGVPTRQVAAEAVEPIAAAYEMAQSSRFEIGVSVAPGKVVLHERHMPAAQPVLTFDASADPRPMCRLMGSNAARMVVHLPFRFGVEDETADAVERPPRRHASHTRPVLPASTEPPVELDPTFVRVLATTIARVLQERGVV